MSFAKNAAVACFLVASFGTAHAASDADAARKFGLLGQWAVDCSKPASSGNPYEAFSVASDGTITRMLKMNVEGLDGPTTVKNLRMQGKDKLSSTWVRVSDGSTTLTTMQKKGDKRHGWKSVAADGHAFITDGKFAGGGDTPWFERCADK